VSDIGEDNLEEVNRLVVGGNYGWSKREGNRAIDVATDPSIVFAQPGNDATFGYRYPVAQYDHEEGDTVAGGFVYRKPSAAPASLLDDQFVFGDIVNGRVFYADDAELVSGNDGDPATPAQVYELGRVDDLVRGRRW